MIEAYWLNVGSIILGVIAWGIPTISIILHKKGSGRKKGASLIASFGACGLSLCMQIFYTDYLVEIGDWSALMDTQSTVAYVSLILLTGTIILNLFSEVKKGGFA